MKCKPAIRTVLRPLLYGFASLSILAAGSAAAQQLIRYGNAVNNMGHSPGMMGVVAPEIFARHGIKVELTDFRGNSINCMAGVISGAVDVCSNGTTFGTDALAEGGNFKGVAVLISPAAEIILSSKSVAKLGNVTPNSPIEDRIRALKGQRIASCLIGCSWYILMDAMLKKVGMTIADIKYRPMTDTVAMMEGLRQDQHDSVMWTVGNLSGVIADKTAVRWINLAAGDVPEFRAIPLVTVYAHGAWVEKNPDLTNRLHAAIADSLAALKKDPAKYSPILKARYAPALDQAIWDDSYKQALPAYFDGARTQKAGWDYQLKLQAENTKKDYSKASFEAALIPAAQAK